MLGKDAQGGCNWKREHLGAWQTIFEIFSQVRFACGYHGTFRVERMLQPFCFGENGSWREKAKLRFMSRRVIPGQWNSCRKKRAEESVTRRPTTRFLRYFFKFFFALNYHKMQGDTLRYLRMYRLSEF